MTGVTSRLRMALGADRAADPTTWMYTDLTARTQSDGTATIRRGQAGSSQEPQPASLTMPLDNGDGALTPRYPASIYYPDLQLGTSAVLDVLAGDPSLLTFNDSGGASTPDTAVLDIVGDIAVAVEYESPLRIPLGATAADVMGKWRTTSNQRSWILTQNAGLLNFFWTTAGTAGTTLSFITKTGIPVFDSGPALYGAWLDVDNGASGRTITFYAGRGTIADLIANPSAFIFETQTVAGTTSIFSSTSPLEIAVNAESTSASYQGRIRAAVVVEGSFAGTQRARPNFYAQTPGTTSFVDAPGRTWTLGAAASIDGYHTRFVGDLAASSPSWPGNGVDEGAMVTWELAGPLRRMRQRDEPVLSCLHRLIMAPINTSFVKAYWPMEDGKDSLSAASPMTDVANMVVGPDVHFAEDSTLHASHPAVHVDGTIDWAAQVPQALRLIGQTHYRWDIFARIDTPNVSPAETNIFWAQTNGTTASWRFTINDMNIGVAGYAFDGTVLVSTTVASDPRMFDTWCLWSFSLTQNGANIDWEIDVVPIPLGIGFGTSGSVAGNVGRATGAFNWGMPAPSTGGISYAHLVISSGTSLGWLAPADSAFAGEPAGSRFFRLCREQNIPALVDGPYGILWDNVAAKGGKPMGPQRPLKLLDLLAECAAVERAVVGEAREVLGLTYRSDLTNQTPVMTFAGELANPFAPTEDDQGTINDITVTRTGGEIYRQVDQDSIDAAGEYPHNPTVNVETSLQLPDLASWMLTEALPDEMRIPSLRVNLGRTPALVPDWLEARFGDLIQSDTTPPFYPAEEVRQLLAYYQEEISRVDWRITMSGVPAGVWDVGVRNDADLGIRDTAGSVLAVAATISTDTSISVATTLGPLWAPTSAANSALPFDLDVGGYRVPCTAIAGQGPIVFGSTGTAAHANNSSITPGLPASIAAGNLLLAWTAIRNSPAGSVSGNNKGYTALVQYENVTLWAKIAEAGETAPTFTITGGVGNADVSGQIVRFTGPFYSVARLLVGASLKANASAADIAYRGINVPEPNCLILYLGWKQDDWTSVATIAGATEIGEPSTITGDDQGIVWDYLIQTTATDIADGSFVVTGGAAAISKGIVAVIRSSVQVFTVSATTFPDVPKTLPAGSPVSVWRPARRALL